MLKARDRFTFWFLTHAYENIKTRSLQVLLVTRNLEGVAPKFHGPRGEKEMIVQPTSQPSRLSCITLSLKNHQRSGELLTPISEPPLTS